MSDIKFRINIKGTGISINCDNIELHGDLIIIWQNMNIVTSFYSGDYKLVYHFESSFINVCYYDLVKRRGRKRKSSNK